MTAAISYFGSTALGMYANTGYYQYQSYHNVCNIAVKERRNVEIKNPNGHGTVTKDVYNYFYS